jgi:DNA-binding NarL/FixJ family response regulator
MAISVILVDDHEVVRDGLRHLIEAQPDLEYLAGFGDGSAAVRYAAARQPNVAIVDIAMPKMNGIEVTRQIHDVCPETEILILSMHADPEFIYQAFRAGARGYVIKESAGAEVVTALRTLRGGQRYVSQKIDAAELERYLSERGEDNPIERLSARERQVLQLIVEGRTSAEVAARLNLSPKSVDTYRSRMMKKLEIDDLASLVKFAIRHGITSLQ